MNTIHYTLRAFATCPFSLSKIGNPYQYKQEVTNGLWKGVSAGGCANHPATYKNNPIFQIHLNSTLDENQLLVELKGPKYVRLFFKLFMI